jgi:ParB-like chromosome segregation protein Spo0J
MMAAPELKQHPLSAAFPRMSADEFVELKDSITNNGVLNPITLFDGMVLDGWHRYQAATETGMDCPAVEIEFSDLAGAQDFVLAQNKARRHISASQLALATTAVYQWRGEGRVHLRTECVIATKTAKELAELAGVGVRSIQQAKEIQTHGAPEVLEAVRSGSMGLPKAAAIARLPKSEQAGALTRPLAKRTNISVDEVPPDEDYAPEEIDAVAVLSEENDRLNDRLAAMAMDATEEERSAAHNTLIELRAKVRTLEATLGAVKISRDTFQNQVAEMQQQINRQRREIDRATGTRSA